jgi:hypothetical protein
VLPSDAQTSSAITKMQAAQQCEFQQTACLAIRGISTGERTIREFGCKSPVEVTKQDISSGMSWQTAHDNCGPNRALCTHTQLCDGDVGREAVPAKWNAVTWLPVADAPNMWIQYGPGSAEINQVV